MSEEEDDDDTTESMRSVTSESMGGHFSSDDEEEEEIVNFHPSVLKYMGNKQSKKLVDPIKESEMDAFMEFC